jgi:hypothetical protein
LRLSGRCLMNIHIGLICGRVKQFEFMLDS